MTDITLDLDTDVLFELMLMAHKRDITLNQLVNEVLKAYIEEHKND
jgi:predicted HicB family RNase H-like nuclease